MNPLFDAVFRHDKHYLEQLIATGITLDETDDDGRTALIHATIEADLEAVRVLIRAGARVNLADAHGFTPLHFAAQNHHLSVARELILGGAVVDAADQYGNTPLWRAVFDSRGRGQMIHLLLEAGARPDVPNHSGVSPEDLANAIGNFNVKQFLG
jgi:ankyrin repeat protein